MRLPAFRNSAPGTTIAFLAAGLLVACGGGGGGGPAPAVPVTSPIGFPTVRTSFVSGGHIPRRMATGFFDGDAYPDIAAGHEHDGGVSILLGRGDGTFEGIAPLVAGLPGPNRAYLCAGNFDLDPFLDLVVVDNVEATMQVFLGAGDGTFDPVFAVPIDVGAFHIQDLAVGPLDDDVLDDVVLATETGIYVYLATGGGGLAPAPGSPHVPGPDLSTVHVAQADSLTGLDIVTCSYPSGLVHILRGNNHGEFAVSPMSPVAVAEGPVLAVIASIDGIGGPDLVAVTQTPPGVRIYLGTNNTTFTPTAQGHGGLLGLGPAAVAVVPRPRPPYARHDDVVVLSLTLGANVATHLTRLRPADDTSGIVFRTSETSADLFAQELYVFDADQDGEPDLLMPLLRPEGGLFEVRLGG